MPALPEVRITTDGACKGNPGPGGWAAILQSGSHEKELTGAEALTTNNRMEMTAALKALEALKKPSHVTLVTDSRYLMDGMMKWLNGWKKNGWRNASKEPVKNADLWMALDRAAKPHAIEWQWVKGHSGHPMNERADALANEAIDSLRAAQS
ncbi:ribonuclease HI [Sandaracinobacteroides hominis]|uniref:ribonuclease HI n=1 Tax=Sandaracinobacteroides hominis TaxID=2780086 RepID=UPI0018F3C229|nr:ribonuclease HI [Sandaracinobacteroides hominis]